MQADPGRAHAPQLAVGDDRLGGVTGRVHENAEASCATPPPARALRESASVRAIRLSPSKVSASVRAISLPPSKVKPFRLRVARSGCRTKVEHRNARSRRLPLCQSPPPASSPASRRFTIDQADTPTARIPAEISIALGDHRDPPPADSFPEGFRTTAPAPHRTSSMGRRPKPSTIAVLGLCLLQTQYGGGLLTPTYCLP